MTNLAYVTAFLVVSAGLAGLALRLLRQVREKRRSPLRWMAAFLGIWLGVLALAALAGRAAYERLYHAVPGFWAIYVPAVTLAFGAALALGWRLSRLPSVVRGKQDAPQNAERAPTPLPTPIPLPPPTPPAVITFKFACPHCGQRLAVTTADVGTSAECPNCATPLTVPDPETA